MDVQLVLAHQMIEYLAIAVGHFGQAQLEEDHLVFL